MALDFFSLEVEDNDVTIFVEYLMHCGNRGFLKRRKIIKINH